MTNQSQGQTQDWTPNTHHQVPQPAGKQCADWYERVNPDADEILYALAHTKGQLDALAAALREFVRLDEESISGLKCNASSELVIALDQARAALKAVEP